MRPATPTKIWLFFFVAVSAGWGIPWSVCMAIITHEKLLFILPLGLLCGLFVGALMASLVVWELRIRQMPFVGPLDRQAEVITTTLARFGYHLSSRSADELSFTFKRSIVGYTPVVTIRETGTTALEAVGPRGVLWRLRGVIPKSA